MKENGRSGGFDGDGVKLEIFVGLIMQMEDSHHHVQRIEITPCEMGGGPLNPNKKGARLRVKYRDDDGSEGECIVKEPAVGGVSDCVVEGQILAALRGLSHEFWNKHIMPQGI